MVIDGDVDVVEPDPHPPVGTVVDRVVAIEAPAAALRDTPELLDVDMEQVAGARVFIAQLCAP
ncbi:hypothetical protein GCM10011588_46310 [Nocardia jinanensis]|uniref:Uncharacterized protein n=1 Tax=Nocardia jinanensis TaxID=382504 RepID=A0A917VX55_9NOCA|nr:hypothetical protein GCM10011588_46310 [Nocardia jinanensis]